MEVIVKIIYRVRHHYIKGIERIVVLHVGLGLSLIRINKSSLIELLVRKNKKYNCCLFLINFYIDYSNFLWISRCNH